MPEKCLNEPVLIPTELFDTQVASLVEGIIPWVFGSGGFSSSMASRVQPRLAYASPSVIRLEFPSYSYEAIGCIFSSPRVIVELIGYCCKGVFHLHVQCQKGHKRENVLYRALPGLNKMVADPLLSSPCGRKFAARDVPLEFGIIALSKWLYTMLTNSVNKTGPGTGLVGWAPNFLLAGIRRSIIICSDDCYSIIQGTTNIVDILWTDVEDRYVFTLDGIPPFEKSTDNTLVKFVDSETSIGVVDTTNRAIKLFTKVNLNCEGDYVLYETNGFFKSECFVEPEEEKEPEDDDPRWRKFCEATERCASQVLAYWGPDNSFDNLAYLPVPGRYELPVGGRVPVAPTQYHWEDKVETYPDGSILYQITKRVDVFEEQVTTVVTATDTGCVTKRYTVIIHVFSKKFTHTYSPNVTGPSMAAVAANEAKAGLPAGSWITTMRQLDYDSSRTPRKCGDPIEIDGPKMDKVPKIDREKDGPCPGKCYLKGTLSIDILFFCKPLRLFLQRIKADAISDVISFVRSLNPGFRETTITKQNIDLAKDSGKPDSTKKMQLEIGIPFTICLDSGEQTVGGFTVGIEDNIVFAMYKGRRFDFDINSILAAYNAAEFLVDAVNPTPIGITDLEVICDEGDLG